MSELIQSWLGTLFQAVTAVGVMYAIWTGVQAKRSAIVAAHQAVETRLAAEGHAARNLEAFEHVATNITKIEIATNSMKDALVASTDLASGLAGEKRGIVIGREQAERAAEDARNPSKERKE